MILNKPYSLLSAYQFELISLGLDDSCPAYMFRDYKFHNDDEKINQILEFIFSCISCRLIEDWTNPDASGEEIVEELEELIKKHGNWMIAWHMIFFAGTKRLVDLLEKYELRSWQATEREINFEFLEKAFGD